MRPTGIELLAADLGTTPAWLAIYIAAAGLVVAATVVWACWKLSSTPSTESFAPGPKPQAPSPKPRRKAA